MPLEAVAARVRGLETQTKFTYFDVWHLGVGVATQAISGHANATDATFLLANFAPALPDYTRYVRCTVYDVDAEIGGQTDIEFQAIQSIYPSAVRQHLFTGVTDSNGVTAVPAILAVKESVGGLVIRPTFGSGGQHDITVYVHGYYV